MGELFETVLHINLMHYSKSYTPWAASGRRLFSLAIVVQNATCAKSERKTQVRKYGCWLRGFAGGDLYC